MLCVFVRASIHSYLQRVDGICESAAKKRLARAALRLANEVKDENRTGVS